MDRKRIDDLVSQASQLESLAVQDEYTAYFDELYKILNTDIQKYSTILGVVSSWKIPGIGRNVEALREVVGAIHGLRSALSNWRG